MKKEKKLLVTKRTVVNGLVPAAALVRFINSQPQINSQLAVLFTSLHKLIHPPPPVFLLKVWTGERLQLWVFCAAKCLHAGAEVQWSLCRLGEEAKRRRWRATSGGRRFGVGRARRFTRHGLRCFRKVTLCTPIGREEPEPTRRSGSTLRKNLLQKRHR